MTTVDTGDQRSDSEDVWEVPERWRTAAEPFRGVNNPKPIDLGSTGVHEILRSYRPQLEHSLAATRAEGFEHCADEALAYLAAPDTYASTLGAAAVWTLICVDFVTCHCANNYAHSVHVAKFIRDHVVASWVVAHGPAFAAEAALRCADLDVRHEMVWTLGRQIYPLAPARTGRREMRYFQSLAGQIRRVLATCSDADYATAVQRLSALRAADPDAAIHLGASYLLPGQQDWLDADLARADLPDRYTVRHVAPSLTTAAQLARFLEVGTIQYWHEGPRYSVLTQVGPPAADLIIDEFRSAPAKPAASLRKLAALLAHFPTDAAFRALVDRGELPAVAPALTTATSNYPRRAMRLLSADAADHESPETAERFRLHACAHPHLIASHADPRALPLLRRADSAGT
ncbi:hypothetical protein JK358_16170 [Nocardia sp. 2]|uniref:Uncharacterized protein n=1 Tax=Nocardia acididurans TaxID=2802282 RepID=A0ABS1M6V0_9NOCA|nr:hypothetical protein [Nocardia acididurans]MBL1075934.1 hypothetical protein [Nocardia acididurans]